MRLLSKKEQSISSKGVQVSWLHNGQGVSVNKYWVVRHCSCQPERGCVFEFKSKGPVLIVYVSVDGEEEGAGVAVKYEICLDEGSVIH